MTDARRNGDRRKAPAYQHYAKDWLVDTAHLTLEEQGAYQRLLDHQWVRAEGIPESERDRAKLLAVPVLTFRRIWKRLSTFFPNGLNPRLEEVRREQHAYHERKVAGGKASAVARLLQHNPNTTPTEGATEGATMGQQEANPSSSSSPSPNYTTKTVATPPRGLTA